MFLETGYIYIKNFLSLEECREAVCRMLHSTINNNHMDEQCPLSDNYYNLYPDILETKINLFEELTGYKLLPAYSYSRIYKKGEKLINHKDRDACEITATVTLGFKGNKVWPIHMDTGGEIKIFEIGVGDCLVMQGAKYHHWRDEYIEGDWQAQVFFHYIDANGPYTSQAYDAEDQKNYHERYKVY
jgi:hypothetical protein